MLEKEEIKLLKLADAIDYSDMVEIINSTFEKDRILKIELPNKDIGGCSITYTDENLGAGNIYIGSTLNDVSYISHFFPYWYQKGLRGEGPGGYDRITRVLLEEKEAEMFADKIETCNTNGEFGGSLHVSNMYKIPPSEKSNVMGILDRTASYIELILAINELSIYYRKQITLRGSISLEGIDTYRFEDILDKIKKIKEGKIKIKDIDLKGLNQTNLPKIDHPPYYIFNHLKNGFN